MDRDLASNPFSELFAHGLRVSRKQVDCFVDDGVGQGSDRTAAVMMGRNANGRVEWKNEAGLTLKRLQEQNVPASEDRAG